MGVVCLAGVLLSACGGGGSAGGGIDFRDDEFNANPGLGAVNADAAYLRGAFGQGVTIAVIDSGIAATNPEFSGRIAAGHPAQNATTNANGDHGTFVAGVIGAARDGSGVHGIAPSVHLMPLRAGGSGEDFAEASFTHAATQSVQIINNSYGFLYPFNAIDRATGATVLFNGPVLSPLLDAYRGINDNIINTTRRRLSAFAESMDDRDMVAVWAAGNEFWHPGAAVRIFNVSVNAGNLATLATVVRTPEYIISNYVIGVQTGGARLSVSMRAGLTFTANAAGYTISAFAPYGVDSYSWGPRYHPELLGRWIAAIAVDNNGMLARFSNACGAAKNWCLAAPGVSVAVVGDGVLMTASGTSFSAPYVSGALALMKSRYPQMPMSVIARLLLQTADNLGADGVDDIYGHGMMNLSAAMLAQSNARMLMPNGAPLPLGGEIKIPNAFAAFGDRLGVVRSAVRVLGDQYYDAPVNVVVADAPELSSFRVIDNLWDDDNGGGGGINKGGNMINNRDIDGGVNFFAYRGDNGVLHSAGGNYYHLQLRHHWFGESPVWNVINDSESIGNRPFFFSAAGGRSSEVAWRFDDAINIFAARGNEAEGDYRQVGLRWQRQQGGLSFSSALSHIGEDDTLLGGKFGGAMPLTGGGKTKMAELAAKWQLPEGFGFDNNSIGKFHLFGNYQYAAIDAKLGGLASGVSGLQAQGWQAGITADNILRGGDKLRLAIGEEMAISGGKINLHYARAADAEFDEDTQLMINRGWQPAQQSINLAAPARPMISAAYGMRLNNNAKLSFGITRTTTPKENKTQAAITYRLNF